MSSSVSWFHVLFSSALKKCDGVKGYVIVDSTTNWMWLKDSQKHTIRKGMIGPELVRSIVLLQSVKIAGYCITIVDQIVQNTATSSSESSSKESQEVTTVAKVANDAQPITAGALSIPPAIEPESSSPELPELDSQLRKVMKPHQIAGYDFIVKNLCANVRTVKSTSSSDTEAAHIRRSGGAILADDVGTGKTLLSISVLWSLCRHGLGKGLIVCPSSLVSNWDAEIHKWLPQSLARSVLVLHANSNSTTNFDKYIRKQIRATVSAGMSNTECVIYHFAKTHPSVRPALIISYDMYRIHSQALGSISSLSLLICDEGHRLKNLGDDGKTVQALCRSPAEQRLVLTGTPYQNNMDELYSIVQFVAPNFLGTLAQFKIEYADPIIAGQMPSASLIAKNRGLTIAGTLRSKLQTLMIRRSQYRILKSQLPARTEYRVYCTMSQIQIDQYTREVENHWKRSGACDRGYNGVQSSETGDTPGEAEGVDHKGKKKRKVSKATTSDQANTNTLEIVSTLRQICNVAFQDVGSVRDSTAAVDAMSTVTDTHTCMDTSTIPSEVLATKAANRLTQLAMLFQHSSKLRVVMELIRAIELAQEKVIIVSNFTSTLDVLQKMLRLHRLSALRLDGTTPQATRTNIVTHFNQKHKDIFILLLSAKAGGVGLNVTGASRMILFEPDWNPSTDVQAMGRIWRVGQTKPVYIYRLCAIDTVEESIFKRQQSKNVIGKLISSQEAVTLPSQGNDEDGSVRPKQCAEVDEHTELDAVYNDVAGGEGGTSSGGSPELKDMRLVYPSGLPPSSGGLESDLPRVNVEKVPEPSDPSESVVDDHADADAVIESTDVLDVVLSAIQTAFQA